MGHGCAGNYFQTIVENFLCFVFLAFLYQLAGKLDKHTAVCQAHAHDCLVNIDIRIVNASELKLVHQVVIHFFRIDACVECCGIERSDAVGKTFLNEVVA